jgi:ankyrin repeat protein
MLSRNRVLQLLQEISSKKLLATQKLNFAQRSDFIYRIIFIDHPIILNGKNIDLNEVVKIIVDNNPRILNQVIQELFIPLNAAVVNGNYNLVCAFLNNGSDPNYKHPVHNVTPLDLAVVTNMNPETRKKIIRILYEKGARDCGEWRRIEELTTSGLHNILDIVNILAIIRNYNYEVEDYKILITLDDDEQSQNPVIGAINKKNRQLIFELSKQEDHKQFIASVLKSTHYFIIANNIIDQQKLNIPTDITEEKKQQILIINGLVSCLPNPKESIKACILFLGTLDKNQTKDLLNSYHYQDATPFQIAIENEYYDTALVLFEHGASCYAQYKKTSAEQIRKFHTNLNIFKKKNVTAFLKAIDEELRMLENDDFTTKNAEEVNTICHQVIERILFSTDEYVNEYQIALRIGSILMQKGGELEIFKSNIPRFLPNLLLHRNGSEEEKQFLVLLINHAQDARTANELLGELSKRKSSFNRELLKFSFSNKDGKELKFSLPDHLVKLPLGKLWQKFCEDNFDKDNGDNKKDKTPKKSKRSKALSSLTPSNNPNKVYITRNPVTEPEITKSKVVPTLEPQVVEVVNTTKQPEIISHLLEAIKQKDIQEIVKKINESNNLYQVVESKTQLDLIVDFLKDPQNQNPDLYLVLDALLIKIADTKDKNALQKVMGDNVLGNLIEHLYKKSLVEKLQKDRIFYRKMIEQFLDARPQPNLPQNINMEPAGRFAPLQLAEEQPENLNVAAFDASLLFEKLKLTLLEEVIIDDQELERGWQLLPENLQLKLYYEASDAGKFRLFNILHKQTSAALIENLSTSTAQIRKKLSQEFGAGKIGVSGSSVYHTLLQDFKGAEHFSIRKTPSDIDMFCVLPVGKMRELGTIGIEKLVKKQFTVTDYDLVPKNGKLIHSNYELTSVSFSLKHKQTGELIDLNLYDQLDFERFHQWQFGYDRLEIVWKGDKDGELKINGSQEDAADFCWQIYQEPEKFWQPNLEANKFLHRLLGEQGCLETPGQEILAFLKTAIGCDKIKSDLQAYLLQLQTLNPNKNPNLQFIAICNSDQDKSDIYSCLDLGPMLNELLYQTPKTQARMRTGTTKIGLQNNNYSISGV